MDGRGAGYGLCAWGDCGAGNIIFKTSFAVHICYTILGPLCSFLYILYFTVKKVESQFLKSISKIRHLTMFCYYWIFKRSAV